MSTVKRSPAYTLAFALAVGAGCAALLTATRELTAERRLANRQATRIRHILDVLAIDRSMAETNEAVVALFEGRVRVSEIGGFTVYERVGPGRRVEAVAVPFQGAGLWGTIRGFLALDPAGRTIRRITFHEHNETPGLGAKIEDTAFRLQFVGKPILGTREDVAIEVDAITGATMTSDRVEVMINRTLRALAAARGQSGEATP